MWIDSHCHITADRFDEDRADAIARALDAGVDLLMAIGSGYGLEHNELAAAMAESHDHIFATAGLHPHDASQWDDAAEAAIRNWLSRERVVAIGECGLDYHYMNSPREAQRNAFAAQVALARELAVPVSIHVRDDGTAAYDELLEIWRSEGHGEIEGVLHCYTGSLEFAERALEYGFWVSFSGIVTFKNSQELREVARSLPLDRILVETDAPFLAPQGYRGKRNEPAWVPAVGETLAQLHSTGIEEIARITSANTRRVFQLGKR